MPTKDARRCPPSHVRRLLALDCPINEIVRITGYTAAEIARELENEDSGQEELSYYADGPSRFEDSPRYRADMIDAGRGRLVR